MPDPFRHVRPGESLGRGNLSATAWNAMLDAGKAFRAGRPAAAPNQPVFPKQGLILVRNDTGSDLDVASVLGLNGPVFDPGDSVDSFLRYVVFAGVTPAASVDTGRFAVLAEPVPDGAVAKAYLTGVCPVLVDVTDLDHDRADVTDADPTQLTSGYDGSAEILWKEADSSYYGYATGTQWCLVRLGSRRATMAWFKSTSTINAATTVSTVWTPGTGTATRVRWDGSNWTTVETGVTVYNGNEKHTATSSGVFFEALTGDDGRWWVAVPAKCADWTT